MWTASTVGHKSTIGRPHPRVAESPQPLYIPPPFALCLLPSYSMQPSVTNNDSMQPTVAYAQRPIGRVVPALGGILLLCPTRSAASSGELQLGWHSNRLPYDTGGRQPVASCLLHIKPMASSKTIKASPALRGCCSTQHAVLPHRRTRYTPSAKTSDDCRRLDTLPPGPMYMIAGYLVCARDMRSFYIFDDVDTNSPACTSTFLPCDALCKDIPRSRRRTSRKTLPQIYIFFIDALATVRGVEGRQNSCVLRIGA